MIFGELPASEAGGILLAHNAISAVMPDWEERKMKLEALLR
jgi:hypothetical protein